MLYAATAFWLMVIVLSAGAVHSLWSTMAKPRIVNIVLMPGTLVAQLGHVFGLLITGATVSNASLIRDAETAEPEHTTNPKPRIPVIGPIVIGLLPILTCATGIVLAARMLGGGTARQMVGVQVDASLPLSVAAFWELLRSQITLMEETWNAICRIRLADWKAWLFVYLLVCMTVRMAPFPGGTRGSLGAIVLVGIAMAIAGALTSATDSLIERGWSILSLSVSSLLLLLMLTLAVRGVVLLVQLLANRA